MRESKELYEAVQRLNQAREDCLEILKKEFPVGSKWGVNRMHGQKNPTPGLVCGHAWHYVHPVVKFQPINPPKLKWGHIPRRAGRPFHASPSNIVPLANP